MNILVSGSPERIAEIKSKLPQDHKITFNENYFMETAAAADNELPDFSSYEIIFDLNADDPESAGQLYNYQQFEGTVICCAVKQSLSEFVASLDFEPSFGLAGFNALPTFIQRSKAEISVYREEDEVSAKELFTTFGWEPLLVADRVGMISPRVIMMIINEACLTLQEGTASAEDIDSSMKLGTNYLYGPLQWADLMGVKDVYETLSALYFDTHDERYKPCPLLKTKYLRGEKFFG